MTGYIANYRRLHPNETQGKTDLEIAMALIAADPTLALRVPEINKWRQVAEDRAKVRQGAAFGPNIVRNNIAAQNRKIEQQMDERGWFETAFTDPYKRGLLMAEQADIIMGDLSPGGGMSREEIRRLVEVRKKMEAIEVSDEFREFQEANGIKEWWGEFWGWKETPTIISEVVTESLTALFSHGWERVAAGAGAGAATGAAVGAWSGPGSGITATAGAGYGAMAGFGTTSYNLAATSKYLQAIQDTVGSEVMDNPDLLFEAMNDPKVHKKARDKAIKYGLPIGLVDTLSIGLAGRSVQAGQKLASSAATKAAVIPKTSVAQQAARAGLLGTSKVAPIAVPMGFQMVMGASGEALGQLSSEKKIENWKDVFLEGVAEFGMAPIEIVASRLGKDMTAEEFKALGDRIRRKGGSANEQKQAVDIHVQQGLYTEAQGEAYKDYIDKVFEAQHEGTVPLEEKDAVIGMDREEAIASLNRVIDSQEQLLDATKRLSQTEGFDSRMEFVVAESEGQIREWSKKETAEERAEYAEKHGIEIRNLSIEEVAELTNVEGKAIAPVSALGEVKSEGVGRKVTDEEITPEHIEKAGEKIDEGVRNRARNTLSKAGFFPDSDWHPASLIDEGKESAIAHVDEIWVSGLEQDKTLDEIEHEILTSVSGLNDKEKDLISAAIALRKSNEAPPEVGGVDVPFAHHRASRLEHGTLVKQTVDEQGNVIDPPMRVKDESAAAPVRDEGPNIPEGATPDFVKVLTDINNKARADKEASRAAAEKARKSEDTSGVADLPLFSKTVEAGSQVKQQTDVADNTKAERSLLNKLTTRASEILSRLYPDNRATLVGELFGDEVISHESNVGTELEPAERKVLEQELNKLELEISELSGRMDKHGGISSDQHAIRNPDLSKQFSTEEFGLFAVPSEPDHRGGDNISRIEIWRRTAVAKANSWRSILMAEPFSVPVEDVAWDAFAKVVSLAYQRVQNEKARGTDVNSMEAAGVYTKFGGAEIISREIRDISQKILNEKERLVPKQKKDRKTGKSTAGHVRTGSGWVVPTKSSVEDRIAEQILESAELSPAEQTVPPTVQSEPVDVPEGVTGGGVESDVRLDEPIERTRRDPSDITQSEEAKGKLSGFIKRFMDKLLPHRAEDSSSVPEYSRMELNREISEIIFEAVVNAIDSQRGKRSQISGKTRSLNRLRSRMRRLRATLTHLHGTKLTRVVRFLSFRTDPAFKVEAVKDDSAFGGWTYKIETTKGGEGAITNEQVKAIQEFYEEQGVYNENADANVRIRQSDHGRSITVNLRDFIGQLRTELNVVSKEAKTLERAIVKAEAEVDVTRNFKTKDVAAKIRNLYARYNRKRQKAGFNPFKFEEDGWTHYKLADPKNPKGSEFHKMNRGINRVLREMLLQEKFNEEEIVDAGRGLGLFSESEVGPIHPELTSPLTRTGRGTLSVSEAVDLLVNDGIEVEIRPEAIRFIKELAENLNIEGIHLGEIKTPTRNPHAVYLYNTDQIVIDPRGSNLAVLQAVFEETLHAASVNGVLANPTLYGELQNTFSYAKSLYENDLTVKGRFDYAFSNSLELMAHALMNGELQNWLNRQKESSDAKYNKASRKNFISGKRIVSLWAKLKGIIHKALGIDVKSESLLEEIINLNARGMHERQKNVADLHHVATNDTVWIRQFSLDYDTNILSVPERGIYVRPDSLDQSAEVKPMTNEGFKMFFSDLQEMLSENPKSGVNRANKFERDLLRRVLNVIDEGRENKLDEDAIRNAALKLARGSKMLSKYDSITNEESNIGLDEIASLADQEMANVQAISEGQDFTFSEGEVSPTGEQILNEIRSKIDDPKAVEGPIRSGMTWWERFKEGMITSEAILDTFQSKMFKTLRVGGETRVSFAELSELQAGSPVKADHRVGKFMLDLADKIGGAFGLSKKIEADFNTYALIRRIEDRLISDAEADVSLLIQDMMDQYLDENTGAWTGTEEQKVEFIGLVTKSKEVGSFKNLADLPRLGEALDALVNQINDESLMRFVRDDNGDIIRVNGVPKIEGKFEDALGVYREHMSEALFDLLRADVISPQSYNRIGRSSSFYMPFYVLKYFNKDPKDTFGEFIKGIKDDDFQLISALDAAQFKLYNTQLRIDRNMFMREIEKLRTDFDPDGQFIIKTETLDEAKSPIGMDHVKWHENGQVRYFWIDKDVANVLNRFNPVSATMTYDVMKRMGDIFKMGATGVNLFFQTGNFLIADPIRLLSSSKAGLRAADGGLSPFILATQYIRAFAAASWANLTPNSIKNLIRSRSPEFGTSLDTLYEEFINSGAAGSTIAEYFGKGTAIKDPIERHNRKSKLNWMNAKLSQLGKTLEQTAKMVGIQRMKVFEGIDDLAARIDKAKGAEKVALQNEMQDRMNAIAVEIRNYAGSPDFMRKGKWTENEALNVVFLFFNARVQGVERDMNRLSKVFSDNPEARREGFGTMMKLSAFAALPTLMAWGLNRRDKDREDDYAEVSDEEKKRYFMIPLDSFFEHPYIEGKMVRDYIRIPRRESYGLFSYTMEKGLDWMYERDPEAVSEMISHWVESSLPINIHGAMDGDFGKGLESAASNLNPVLRAPAELIGNRNFFRHKPIVPPSLAAADPSEQFYDTTPDIYKGYGISPLKIKHLVDALTAGGVTQFMPPKDVGDGGIGRRIASTPILSRLARSTFLAEDEIEEIMEDAYTEDATARVLRRRAITKFMKDTRGLSIQERVRLIPPATNGDEQLRNEGIVRRLRAIALGMDDDEIRLQNATVNVRSSVIIKRIQSMTPAEVKVYLTDLARKKILTHAVGHEVMLKLHNRGESIHDYLREPVR